LSEKDDRSILQKKGQDMSDDNNRRPDIGDLNIPYEVTRATIWNNPDEGVRLYGQGLWFSLGLIVLAAIITLIVDGLGIKW
jgi:hypothetical protein